MFRPIFDILATFDMMGQIDILHIWQISLRHNTTGHLGPHHAYWGYIRVQCCTMPLSMGARNTIGILKVANGHPAAGCWAGAMCIHWSCKPDLCYAAVAQGILSTRQNLDFVGLIDFSWVELVWLILTVFLVWLIDFNWVEPTYQENDCCQHSEGIIWLLKLEQWCQAGKANYVRNKFDLFGKVRLLMLSRVPCQ